ncbi:MAG: hypothetical protein ACP5N3_02170 [Candidatus Nanoarchaeia archaeon]
MGILYMIDETKRKVFLAIDGNEAFFKDAQDRLDSLLNELNNKAEPQTSNIRTKVISAKKNFELYVEFAKKHNYIREHDLKKDHPGITDHKAFHTQAIKDLNEAEQECKKLMDKLTEDKEKYINNYNRLIEFLSDK